MSKKRNWTSAIDTGTVAVPNELVIRAMKIIKRYDEIIKDHGDLALSENDGERRFAPDISSLREVGSDVCERSILGREHDKDSIVKKLLSTEDELIGNRISVQAIVGMGGLGKTTLAQLVYNDPRVSQSFDKLAWVCVSQQFDVSNITRKIILSLKEDKCDVTELANLQRELLHVTELANLQRKLLHEIKEQKVLLVLDDVWNEQGDSWERLCTPLSKTRVCKIVVTTRSEVVARLVQTMPFYRINILSPADSWSLFTQVAFAVHQENDTPVNLVEIGRSIVNKCEGLPLAIKTLACMLRCETDEMRWRYVLESELWNLEQSQNGVLPALMLSYKHMPVQLKRCFVALSLFPKDHLLSEGRVLHLWKILDLLQCEGSNNEDQIGWLYFNGLVQRSFLQVYFGSHTMLGLVHDLACHTMHGLVHDLACFLAGEEFFRLEGDTPIEIPRNARYVSIPEADTSVEISNASHSVRAIIVLAKQNVNIIQNPEALFLNCKKLRALSLGQSNLSKALPDNMGSLKLLRHLKFDNDCGEPTTSGIRRRINLHRLPPIHMSRCDCNYNIRELRNLNKIRELRIERRGSLCLIEDANEAQLLNKKHLRSLELDFFDGGQPECCPHSVQTEPDTVTHEQLLDSLRPHYGLRELTIENYESQKYPDWLGDASFRYLTKIVLVGGKSQHVPTLGVLPSLKSLEFLYMLSVQRIGREFCSLVPGMKGFQSLERLEFFGMHEWSEWSGVDDGDFPRLHTLVFDGAKKLRSLPLARFPSLVALNLRFCENLATVPTWPTLRELRIVDCGGLNELAILPSLTTLYLQGALQDETLHRLLNYHPSLQCVTIICDSTAYIPLDPQCLPSLRKLRLSCPNLRYCDGIAGLTCLKELKLWGCPKLPVHRLLPRQLENPEIRDRPAWHFDDFDHPGRWLSELACFDD